MYFIEIIVLKINNLIKIIINCIYFNTIAQFDKLLLFNLDLYYGIIYVDRPTDSCKIIIKNY